ncbi:hypothetical protein KCU93_g5828, partial [Aureobasidium melanogenum]|jgi:hypothetical protein
MDRSRQRERRETIAVRVCLAFTSQSLIHTPIDADEMAQSTQISVSEPAVENAMPHSPVLAAKRSHDQVEPIADVAPKLKKVKTNDDTLEANGLEDTQMRDVQEVESRKQVQETEFNAALAVLDDGVKESDTASGRSEWCMALGEL